jgi:hypothetical protein
MYIQINNINEFKLVYYTFLAPIKPIKVQIRKTPALANSLEMCYT